MLYLGKKHDYDIVITEIGGTVGDIESQPYLEAIRQLRWKLGPTQCITIHLTLVPFLKAAGELKTKPTQHSVKELLENGIQPDILVCRTEYPLNKDLRRKIALFCNVNQNAVIEAIDVPNIYDVPLVMRKEKLDKIVLAKLKLAAKSDPDLEQWISFTNKLKNPKKTVHIALVGKYVELQDAYKSISEAFIHAGAVNEAKVKVHYIHSEHINKDNVAQLLAEMDGVLVAPGFGERGIEGKFVAVKYVREHNVPFFGICLGMQCAVIEFARNVLQLEGAHSTEMSASTSYPVIDLMEEQKTITIKGGTMRLGAYKCHIKQGTKAFEVYGEEEIKERHRHRYEFNNEFKAAFEKAGMIASGINPDNELVEIVELKKHPWFVGVQFHPELKSTVMNPHPLFVNFVQAALNHQAARK